MTNKVLDVGINEYNTVQIGNQLWTASNFNATKFQNGDDIPEAKSEKKWREAEHNKVPIWCYINFNDSLKNEKEKLYNWYAATNQRGLAPTGWRVPTQDDFIKLFYFLGAQISKYNDVFNVVGNKLKSRFGWDDFLNNGIVSSGNGSNESGFNGSPNGEYMEDPEYDGCLNMHFNGLGFLGCWWSSTEDKEFNHLALQCVLRQYTDYVTIAPSYKSNGASIRFLKDLIK